MKRLWMIFWCSVLAVQLEAVTATLSVRPARPVSGERFMLMLNVDSEERFSLQLPEMPAGLSVSSRISSNSLNTTIINGRQTVRAEYGLAAVADKAGEFVIPPVTLDFGGEKVTTGQFSFTVRDASQLPAGERLSAVLTITPRRAVYVGETLRADLEIFVPRQWTLQNIRSIVPENFADASFIYASDGRSGNFIQSSEVMRRQEGSTVEFSGIFQVQKSGKYLPECRIDLQVSRGRGDFFFGPPPENKTVIAKSGKMLEVLPLPELPAGVIDSGLVGTWRVDAQISRKVLKAGDIAEITLNFAGAMPSASFRAPEITIPDARVYPPEVTENPRRTACTVKYPFVVLKPGEYKQELTIAVFDPLKGEYVLNKCGLQYTVNANPELASPPSAAVTGNGMENRQAEMPQDARVLPFPLKQPGRNVLLPLWNNVKTAVLLLIAASMAVLIAAFWPRRRKDLRRQRKRELKKLIAAVKYEGSAALTRIGSQQVAELAGLTGRRTFSEIAAAAEDEELKEFLISLDSAGFDPSAPEVRESEELKKKLTVFLKGCLLLISIAFLPLYGGSYTDAKAAFDAGNYPVAAEKLRELTGDGRKAVSPELFYDLGSAEYMQGKYPEAYVMFSRAHLLSPGNAGYAGAVQQVSGKLPGGTEKTAWPDKAALFMRPDHFILTVGVLLLAAAILVLLRRRIPAVLLFSAGAVIAGSIIFSLWTLRIQCGGMYSPERAVVVRQNAQLRSIPANDGGESALLPGGSMLRIREESGGFYRVESGSVSGWIARDAVERIWPYGVF